MRGAVVCGLLLAGCDVIFPLTGPPATDAPSGTLVTGRLLQTTITNNSTLEPAEMMGPLSDVIALARFEDGTSAVIDVDDQGAFSVVRATDAYRIELLFDGTALEIQDTVSDLTIAVATAGRGDGFPVTVATNFVLPTQRPATLSLPLIVTTGQWGELGFGISNSANWGNAAPTGLRRLGLLSASQFDDVFYLEYQNGVFVTGQDAITHVAELQVEMTDGSQTNLPPAVPVTPNGCARLQVELETAGAAARSSMDAIYDSLSTRRTLAVQALPRKALVGLAVANLAGQSVPNLDTPLVDIQYHTPFHGYDVLATAVISATRTLTYPGKFGTSIGSALQVHAEIPTTLDCATASADLSLVAAFPTAFELDGMPMVEGGAVPLDRTVPTLLTWDSLPGEVDLYQVNLLEVVTDGIGTQIAAVRSYRTRQQRVSIEPGVMTPNHYYIFQISGIRGLPMASEGDFVTVMHPVATAFHATPMFQAM